MSVNTDLTKRPDQTVGMSTSEFKEFTLCAINPLYFIRTYCYTQHPVRGTIPIALTPQQEEMLYTIDNFHKSVISMDRQTGKTTCTSAYMLWYAMFHPYNVILTGSCTLGMSKDSLRRIYFMHDALPDFLKTPLKVRNKTTMRFDNGSQIIAQAAGPDFSRGFCANLINLDEFAYIPAAKTQQIMSNLFIGTKIIISSTNKNLSDFDSILQQASSCHTLHGDITETGTNGFKAYCGS